MGEIKRVGHLQVNVCAEMRVQLFDTIIKLLRCAGQI